MNLGRPPVRRPAETIVALIDVVFFLLVFSLLVGRMDVTAPFEVAPPVATVGADLPAGGSTVTIGRDGEFALDGRQIDGNRLVEALAGRTGQKRRLRINADADAEVRHLLRIVDEMTVAGADDMVLIVTPGSE